ncbi:MAG TPA: RNA methyltransferase [Nitrososphaeraceae archaeon]|jgi:predicted SPOUT superfamily RNA methylase MTH1|nr:RNA methyltransferase [Nitrososphaeraceae archaeon]
MKRSCNFYIAIPDSSLLDEQTKRDKSIKISQIARACSIFRVKTIYIYHDKSFRDENDDLNLLKTILHYLDTPQYLRKVLYPRMKILEYAGILHPIKSPHHKDREDIKNVKVGDVRVGVIANDKGNVCVDVGLGSLVPFEGSAYKGKKVNVLFTSPYPNLRAREAIEKELDKTYWGYNVKVVSNLAKLLNTTHNAEILITYRGGPFFRMKEEKFLKQMKYTKNLLVVFGSPKKGVEEILAEEGSNIRFYNFVANMFPFQGTATVRLEEALYGTLAILNHVLTI